VDVIWHKPVSTNAFSEIHVGGIGELCEPKVESHLGHVTLVSVRNYENILKLFVNASHTHALWP